MQNMTLYSVDLSYFYTASNNNGSYTPSPNTILYNQTPGSIVSNATYISKVISVVNSISSLLNFINIVIKQDFRKNLQ